MVCYQERARSSPLLHAYRTHTHRYPTITLTGLTQTLPSIHIYYHILHAIHHIIIMLSSYHYHIIIKLPLSYYQLITYVMNIYYILKTSYYHIYIYITYYHSHTILLYKIYYIIIHMPPLQPTSLSYRLYQFTIVFMYKDIILSNYSHLIK